MYLLNIFYVHIRYKLIKSLKIHTEVIMIISIAHTKGGVGKSTIAWNLATQLDKKYTIEIIDLDFQKTLTYTNEFRTKPFKVLNFTNIKDLTSHIEKDRNDIISIIDVGGFDSDINRLSIIMSDLVITPVSDSGTELLGLMRFEKVLDEMSKAINEEITTTVLINDINPKKTKLNDLITYIKDNKHFNLFDTVLRTRADYGKALDKGLGVQEFNEKSKAAKEFKSFSKEVKKIIEEIL